METSRLSTSSFLEFIGLTANENVRFMCEGLAVAARFLTSSVFASFCSVCFNYLKFVPLRLEPGFGLSKHKSATTITTTTTTASTMISLDAEAPSLLQKHRKQTSVQLFCRHSGKTNSKLGTLSSKDSIVYHPRLTRFPSNPLVIRLPFFPLFSFNN